MTRKSVRRRGEERISNISSVSHSASQRDSEPRDSLTNSMQLCRLLPRFCFLTKCRACIRRAPYASQLGPSLQMELRQLNLLKPNKYRAQKSLCKWLGEFCSCCCLPLLPQLACSILPTMYKDFFQALYYYCYNRTFQNES